VEEEGGLIWAQQVELHFLWEKDAAFIIDHSGMSDIVTSNWSMRFCSEKHGRF